MWKKLLTTLTLTLALTAVAAAAEVTVTPRSLVEVAQGLELSYAVDGAQSETAVLAGLYSAEGRLLDVKLQRLEPGYGGWNDARMTFAPCQSAAYAKLFVLDDLTTCKPVAAAARIERSEEVYVESWTELVNAASKASAGTVFRLKGGTMVCDRALELKRSVPLTIRGSEEETTILDFTPWSDSLLNSPDEVTNVGIKVTGSNVTLENFILQGVPGTGIRFNGAASHHNLLENVVMRYNHNSGVYVSDGAYQCTLRCCDSYRNCDIYKKGQDADGYSVSLDCGVGLVLDNCRAFENADDAYDNFDNHNDVTYLDCYAWNNGGVDVYTGQYDVDHGRPVDRNAPLVRLMCKESEEFAAALDEGRFELPLDLAMTVRSADKTSSITVTLEEYITTVWEGNGNGFKLGSNLSGHGPQVGDSDNASRRLENCISFDNHAKGFDRNHAICPMTVTNFLSFQNNRNYWSDSLNDPTVTNALSYAWTKDSDITDANFPITVLSEQRGEALKEAVYAQTEELRDLLERDVIPGRFLIELDW